MLAGGAIAGTTWLWPRLAWQRIGQVGVRSALIAVGQIVIVAAGLAYLNDSCSFFSSWSALIGPAPARQSAVSLPETARAATNQPIGATSTSSRPPYRGGAGRARVRRRL